MQQKAIQVSYACRFVSGASGSLPKDCFTLFNLLLKTSNARLHGGKVSSLQSSAVFFKSVTTM